MVLVEFNAKDTMRDLRMMEQDAIERVKHLEEEYQKSVSTLLEIQRKIRHIQQHYSES